MPSENMEDRLKTDFDALAASLEKDRFAQNTLSKLNAVQRRRLGVIGCAAALGAVIAASQFMNVVRSIAPALTPGANAVEPAGPVALTLAALIVASALMATAFVLRQES